MASAPLNWLLKVGAESLNTTAKTVSGAVNELLSALNNLNTNKADKTTVSNLSKTVNTKVAKTDLLSLEEIEASTSLANKGAAAESVKELHRNLGGVRFGVDGDGNMGYYGADGSLVPFSGAVRPLGESFNKGANNTVLSTALSVTPSKNTIYVLINSGFCNTPMLSVSDSKIIVKELWSYMRQSTTYGGARTESFSVVKYFKLTNVTPNKAITLTFSGVSTTYAANDYQLIAFEGAGSKLPDIAPSIAYTYTQNAEGQIPELTYDYPYDTVSAIIITGNRGKSWWTKSKPDRCYLLLGEPSSLNNGTGGIIGAAVNLDVINKKITFKMGYSYGVNNGDPVHTIYICP